MTDRVAGGTHAEVETVQWDAATGGFVRLLIDRAGRVLAREDLDPPIKRATLRHLFETRLTRSHRSEIYRLLRGLSLLAPMSRGGALSMPSLEVDAEKLDEAEALAREVGGTVRDLALIAWMLLLIFNRPGLRLPALEDIDAAYPNFPPVVPGEAPPYFCAETLLAEIEADDLGESVAFKP